MYLVPLHLYIIYDILGSCFLRNCYYLCTLYTCSHVVLKHHIPPYCNLLYLLLTNDNYSHPSHPLPHLSPILITYWLYARWYQTRHKGGHATASYASLSMGPCAEKHPLLSFYMSFHHKILLFHRKQFYLRSLPTKTPHTTCLFMLS